MLLEEIKPSLKNQMRDVLEYTILNNEDLTFEPEVLDDVIDEYIDIWAKNKEDFINYFNGNLIYETDDNITITLGDDEKKELINKFKAEAKTCYGVNERLERFIADNEEGFFDNRTIKEYIVNDRTYKPGTKMSKAMSWFISNPIILNNIQQLYSQYVQMNKITGRLCLSVHPMDYLTLSENVDNWRSCHSLDGEYRAGNLAYMLDSSTIVCYIATDKKSPLPHLPSYEPWTSKKWRMLLFLSRDRNAMFAGRHYPFFSKPIMEECKFRITAAMNVSGKSLSLWSSWHNDCMGDFKFKEHSEDTPVVSKLKRNFVFFNGTPMDIKSLFTESDNLFFNDVLYSHCYTPYYCWKINNPYISYKKLNIIFDVGVPKVRCSICGLSYLDYPDNLVCSACNEEGKVQCDCCGNYYNEESDYMYDTVNGLICGDCLSVFYRQCDICGRWLPIEEVTFSEEKQANVCCDCELDEKP